MKESKESCPAHTGYLNPFLSEHLPCFVATPYAGAPASARAASPTAGSSSSPWGPAEGIGSDAATKRPVMSRRGGRLRSACLLPTHDLFIALCFLTAMPRTVDGGAFSLSLPPEARLRTAIWKRGEEGGGRPRRRRRAVELERGWICMTWRTRWYLYWTAGRGRGRHGSEFWRRIGDEVSMGGRECGIHGGLRSNFREHVQIWIWR